MNKTSVRTVSFAGLAEKIDKIVEKRNNSGDNTNFSAVVRELLIAGLKAKKEG